LLVQQLLIQIPCRRYQKDVVTGGVAITGDVLGCLGLDQFDNVIEFDRAGNTTGVADNLQVPSTAPGAQDEGLAPMSPSREETGCQHLALLVLPLP
jgi:hypothetical protein